MVRTGLTALILLVVFGWPPLFGQVPPAPDSADLKVELRSATGSNRFQLGEVIPLEILISSRTPKRYLEPCKMFWESCFGFPQCRFYTPWSFDVIPDTGWTDIGWHGCRMMSGPIYEVHSSDLTAEPKRYSYTLTNRFRFDAPGKYTVRLFLRVGLDDETNQIRDALSSTAKPSSVSKTAEIALEIVPAEDAWKRNVIQQGLAAWTARPPANTGSLKYQQERDALCNLGTPEAAVALAGLLGQGIDVTQCLKINAHKDATEAEMRRLLVDPNVSVRPVFFAAYAKLLSRGEEKPGEISGVPPKVVNDVRATLFASLPKKTPEAMVQSLETVLRNPMGGYWVVLGSTYDLRHPYEADVIAMTAAEFDHLSESTQAALLDTEWEHVRSPLMLPVVRRRAETGDGDALLRWHELDPDAATAFMREEVIRAKPRFSSAYLRLPDESLPAQEQQQIAANFMALRAPDELLREATLLHRYTSRKTLPTVLPFIDQHLIEWPCKLQVPVLAYLLKVSPHAARLRVEQVLEHMSPSYCPQGEFLPSLGFIEAGSVLDGLAAKQVVAGTRLAADAAVYLGRYGSAAMKPLIWEQLSRWHKKYVESGAALRIASPRYTQDDYQLYSLDSRLLAAYVNAQGWTLSPKDVVNLSKLIGDKEKKELACSFSCGSSLSVGPAPGTYYIYRRINEAVLPANDRIDYLMLTGPFHYAVNQYRCSDLNALKQKLLQFPAGSTFSFADTGGGLDQEDWTEISAFLRSYGYSVRN